MRKHLFLIVAAFSLLTPIFQGCSQPKAGHMEFMDISMGENIETFKKALLKKGMHYLADENGMLVFEGIFSNQPVRMGVLGTPSTKMPACIFIDFSEQADRHSVRDMYYSYTAMLVNKYGKYSETQSIYFSHLIQEPTDYGDDTRIADYGTYFSTWKLPTGEIILHIVDNSFLQMIYVDNTNMDIAKQDFSMKYQQDL